LWQKYVCAFHTRTLPTFQGDGKIEARKQEKTGRGERPAGCSEDTAVLKNGRKISYGLSYTPETSRISLRHGYEDVKLSYVLSYELGYTSQGAHPFFSTDPL
jgi:hypothetical protein